MQLLLRTPAIPIRHRSRFRSFVVLGWGGHASGLYFDFRHAPLVAAVSTPDPIGGVGDAIAVYLHIRVLALRLFRLRCPSRQQGWSMSTIGAHRLRCPSPRQPVLIRTFTEFAGSLRPRSISRRVQIEPCVAL